MKEAGGSRKTAVVLIDGEHYPDVTVATLEYIENEQGYELAALVFLGGTEKVPDPGRFSYRSVPLYSGAGEIEELRRALADHKADMVIDLSDEPVLDYQRRFRLVCETLSIGVDYVGADFHFKAPNKPFLCDKPSIGIWGTGKRVGKTAVSGYAARYLTDKGTRTCVLTMGRGGPAQPELLSNPLEVDDGYLRRRVEEGRHAASDHFEDAMMGDVVTVGCRRCGGGLAGEPYYSNVAEGAELACRQECDVILFEGSGASIPPAGVDAVLLTVSALQPIEYILGYLGPYRLLHSDVVVITMCEEHLVSRETLGRIEDGILSINCRTQIVRTVFRPRPVAPVENRKVFVVSTAPLKGVRDQANHLGAEYGVEIVGYSPNLADREKLQADLAEAHSAEVLITELKAAGVDTVSRYAFDNGKDLVYMDNVPMAVSGDLDSGIDLLETIAKSKALERKIDSAE
ncbi:MAG: 2,3-diphosphoglycerate synthetase [Actinobacteria bacterium]|nr:2,3-diphosphoglycerate synthetase [Actinomycetota bacterium]